jgi:hypothetical protein
VESLHGCLRSTEENFSSDFSLQQTALSLLDTVGPHLPLQVALSEPKVRAVWEIFQSFSFNFVTMLFFGSESKRASCDSLPVADFVANVRELYRSKRAANRITRH